MIPVNIDNVDVLRRTLEDMDARIPEIVTVDTIVTLEATADLATTVTKVNELITAFNRLIGQLEVHK